MIQMENFFEQAAAMTKLWTDAAMRMWSAGLSVQPGSPPPEYARNLRNAMFQAMSESMEKFMRSDPMLGWMKHSMDSAVAFRRQINEMMTEMRHQTQGPASEDIDSILRATRHGERRVLERLDEIGERLERIDGRLDSIEEAGERGVAGNGESRARRMGRSVRRVSKTQVDAGALNE